VPPRPLLFVEKEGFAPLFQAARVAERFDVAVMSTKGMSTTAARLLLDRLALRIDKVLVLHDFDVSGFSIFGTLGGDGRRYRFENELRIVDVGLRLADVEAMGLQSEPVETRGRWAKRAATLATHGATEEEIEFLRRRRVELNAMPADVFVAFVEHALAGHGVCKVVPARPVLERQARGVIERRLEARVLREIRARLQEAAAAAPLPEDLDERVRSVLEDKPSCPGTWQSPPSSGAMERRERRPSAAALAAKTGAAWCTKSRDAASAGGRRRHLAGGAGRGARPDRGRDARGAGAARPALGRAVPAEQARIVRALVERVEIGPAGADIRLRVAGLTSLVRDLGATGPGAPRTAA
jgi:hypothetical protein